jgi:deoxyribose-phosphate aldolase
MNLRAVDTKKPVAPAAPAAAPAPGHQRNPGFPLDLDWVGRIRMNRSALERRAGTIGARRTVKKDYQAAWLLKAISLMDLTTLNSDDTAGRVERLCAKARHPLRSDIVAALGVEDLAIQPAAVCVYHAFVSTAVNALAGTAIPVAAVSTAFPHGLAPVET